MCIVGKEATVALGTSEIDSWNAKGIEVRKFGVIVYVGSLLLLTSLVYHFNVNDICTGPHKPTEETWQLRLALMASGESAATCCALLSRTPILSSSRSMI